MPKIVSLGRRGDGADCSDLTLGQVKAYLRGYAGTIEAMIAAGTLALNPLHRAPDGGVQICVHALARDFNVSPRLMTSLLVEGSVEGEIALRWVHIEPGEEDRRQGIEARCWLFAGIARSDRDMPANRDGRATAASISQVPVRPARLSL